MREKEFLNKLAELLAEYNADISFVCDGDTQDLYDDRMTISMDNKIVLDTKLDWYIDSNNIKERLEP